jgi:exodeoxyribonuclease III
MEGYWCYWHGEKGYSGVGLQVSQALSPERPRFSHPSFDYENRIVLVRLPAVTIVSVYVPNGGKDYAAKLNFLRRLSAWVKQVHADGQELVLCGDINIARTDMDVHPRERKADVIGQRAEERELFEDILGTHLVDVGRALNPGNDALFTWWPPWRNMRQRNIGWRIDYVLVSQSIAARATECVVQADVGTSDHAPVMMTTA